MSDHFFLTCQCGDELPKKKKHILSSVSTMNNGRIIYIENGIVCSIVEPPKPGKYSIIKEYICEEVVCSAETPQKAYDYVMNAIYELGPGDFLFFIRDENNKTIEEIVNRTEFHTEWHNYRYEDY